jgi:hypothetical protein
LWSDLLPGYVKSQQMLALAALRLFAPGRENPFKSFMPECMGYEYELTLLS